MIPVDSLNDLKLLVRSRYGLIQMETADSERAQVLLKLLADQLNLPYFVWTSTKGLRRDREKESVYGTTKIDAALEHIEQSAFAAIYHLDGVDGHLENSIVIQRLKDIARLLSKESGAIVMTGASFELPLALKSTTAYFNPPTPTDAEYVGLIKNLVRDMSERNHITVKMSQDEAKRLIQHLKGFTLMEAEKLLTRVMVEQGKLTADAIPSVMKAKMTIVENEGLLEYYPAENTMADIADLKGLKSWLAKRKDIVLNPARAKEFGLEFPKGVLLLGVQGCGKSLCAKAVSMEWGLPLLRFDPSTLYNKYVGESEKNFLRAMQTAEKMAPVILWIDEIEKAFSTSTGEGDGGVSTRILGTFLSWLQERKGDIFIIATANAIDRLPPEFLRKGRFDEIFFVDLPDQESREAVFKIHLNRRKRDPLKFDIKKLAEATSGFSGAEIEQVIVSGLCSAFSSGGDVSTELLLKEVEMTKPLSATMKEKIDALREWASTRTVSAC